MGTRKWLITGGCGFIGRNLVRWLLSRGDVSVRILDNLSVGTVQDLATTCAFRQTTCAPVEMAEAGVELVVGDILDEHIVQRSTLGADIVVHLAANTGVESSVVDPRTDCTTNVIGTLNCLDAAHNAKVRRFVFASSGAPIGECHPPIHEELAAHPVSPYGASKLAGEGYCSAYFRTFGLETVALRFSNVYGPGSTHKSSVVAKFIRRAFAGEPWTIYGSGGQTRDFIFVEDLVRAVQAASTAQNVGGEVFQIATNRETSIKELVSILGDTLRAFNCPEPRVQYRDARCGDVMRNFSDTTKARELLNWIPNTSLAKGLHETVAWFTNICSTRNQAA